MYSKIKHDKKVINQYKFARILNNTDTMMCHVYINRGGKVISGQGVYLNGCVYFCDGVSYYSYSTKEVGAHKDNLCFQLLHLVNPF